MCFWLTWAVTTVVSLVRLQEGNQLIRDFLRGGRGSFDVSVGDC